MVTPEASAAKNDHCRGCANGGDHDSWCPKASAALLDTQDMSTTPRSVYGNASGEWIVLEASDGFLPPPTIGTLHYLGTIADVFASIPRNITQAEIADMMGVSQQAVSRYLNGVTEPRLSSEGWRNVVRMVVRRG